jgi:hypothetical protein
MDYKLEEIEVEILDEEGDVIDWEYYDVEFEFDAYYTPANFNGHPDNWSPAEGDASSNIQTVWKDGKEVKFESLSAEAQIKINNDVVDWVNDNGVDYIQEYNEECRAEAMIDARDDYDDFFDAQCGPYGYEG